MLKATAPVSFLPSPTHLGKLRDGWLSEGKRPLTRADLDETLWPANTGTAYAIMSPSGKWYIGQTRQALKERWKQHAHPSRIEGGCRLIARAFAKYGVDRMELWVLERNVPLSQLNERERVCIAQHGTFDPNGMGYNLTPGGEESPMHLQGVAERSSATHKQQWKDPVHRSKMSKARATKAVREHMANMRATKPELDYWSMPRAKAIKRLKSNRWDAALWAKQHGNDFDPSKYDTQIAEHERRHEEKYYAMPPAKAIRLLQAARCGMQRFHRSKGTQFENEWWYKEQIKAHKDRGEARTSC
jgi:group I intron endonuclease